jgi:TPR repeat protein
MTLLWLYYAKNKNSSKTVAWAYKAAIQDHGRAQNLFGTMHKSGNDARYDHKLALQ